MSFISPFFNKNYPKFIKLKGLNFYTFHVGFKKKIPDTKTPFNNIYLSNFSQIYPMDRGTNYAVRDGLKVARIMLESENCSHDKS